VKHAAAIVAAPIEPVVSAGPPSVPDKVIAAATSAPSPGAYESLKELAEKGATEQKNFDFGNELAGLDSRGFPREIPSRSSASGADPELLILKAKQEQFENPGEFTKAVGGNVEAAFLRRPIDPTGPSSDFTSVFRDPNGDVHGVVADWMGHGQASAWESVETHEAFRAQGLASRLAGKDANEGLREIDEIAQDIMSNAGSSEKTLSASHISLNSDTGWLHHAGAGGDLSTYIARADGTVTELPAESPAMSTLWRYGELGSRNNIVQLNKGDIAFTHSDGLESVIPRERLAGFLGLAARSGASPAKLISRIQRLFKEPDDDISISILRWNGAS